MIYHSHVDAGDYFSETDRQNAMIDGAPAYPQATYVVVSFAEGSVAETRAHRYSPEARAFVEVPLAMDEGAARAEKR